VELRLVALITHIEARMLELSALLSPIVLHSFTICLGYAMSKFRKLHSCPSLTWLCALGGSAMAKELGAVF
jgi:hypothetical protein